MSGGEIIGDIAQGAMIARAAEPAHGEGGDGHTHERACLNCGTALIGSHCHACGQAAHVHRTLGAFFHDLLHGVFHFEGKIWRTLPLLAWRPGKLTREYIDGRRASYVSPIALFLFVVFLTFGLFNLTNGPLHVVKQSEASMQNGFEAAKAESRAEVTKYEAELAAARKAGKPTAAIEERLDEARDGYGAVAAMSEGKPFTINSKLEGTGAASGPEWARGINEAFDRARKNPDLALYKLQMATYKYSWLLIPISVPFVWLLFPFNRRFHLYDHTVFVTYSLCFMLLLLALIFATQSGDAGMITALALLYAPFHMYRQLKGTYSLSRGSALLRMSALTIFAFIALLFFAMIILAVAGG